MRIIAGEARGRQIEAPAGRLTRPTLDRVRENLFNIIQYDVPGSRVLDLFAGSGALSLEALSRGAEFAVLADHDRNACNVQRRNIERLHYENKTRLFCCDWQAALKQISREQEVFDIVFLDPPYSMTNLKDVFNSLAPVVNRDSLIILEHESGREPIASDLFTAIRSRSWGFCAVTLYRLIQKECD